METPQLQRFASFRDRVVADSIDRDLLTFNYVKLLHPDVFEGLAEEVDYLISLQMSDDEFDGLFWSTLSHSQAEAPTSPSIWLQDLKPWLRQMKPTQLERFVILNKATNGKDTIDVAWDSFPEVFVGLVDEINLVLSQGIPDAELQKMFCERVDGLVPSEANVWLQALREELVPMDEILFVPGWSMPKRRPKK